VKAGESAAEAIREITKGRGAELVVDMVGSDDSLALAAAVAKFERDLRIVGLAGGKFAFAFGAVPFETQLCIPYWGTAVELMECLELARQGKIHAHVETSRWRKPRRPTRRCAKATSTAARWSAPTVPSNHGNTILEEEVAFLSYSRSKKPVCFLTVPASDISASDLLSLQPTQTSVLSR
jgi:hypothetical protein